MKVKQLSNGDCWFRCPGCGHDHCMPTNRDAGPNWKFNGDVDKPTFAPSVLVKAAGKAEQYRCHSFITDGRIRFLGDCSHEYAGKVMDMFDVNEKHYCE